MPNYEDDILRFRDINFADLANRRIPIGQGPVLKAEVKETPKREEGKNAKTYFRYFYKHLGGLFQKQGYSNDCYSPAYGIEIENETKAEFAIPRVNNWEYKREPSLRDFGFEFVLRPPKVFKDLEAELRNLFFHVNEQKQALKLSNSVRTSMHVHMDVTKHTWVQVLTLACVYWTLEEILSHYCGNVRQGNLFCLRLKDAGMIRNDIVRALKNTDGDCFNLMCLNRDLGKYGALNFATIPMFGSLEFRLMRGVDNVDEALEWVSILNRLNYFCLEFLNNPGSLHTYIMKQSLAKDVPREILGPFWSAVKAKLPKDFDYEESIRKGYMEVKNITRAVKDWTFETQVNKENLKDKHFPPSLVNKDYLRKYIKQNAPRIQHDLNDPAYVLPPRQFQEYDQEVKKAYKNFVQIHGYIGWKDWYNTEGKKIAKRYIDNYRNDRPAPRPAQHDAIIVDDVQEVQEVQEVANIRLGDIPVMEWDGEEREEEEGF